MSVSYKDIKNGRQWSASIGMTKEKFFELSKHFATAYRSIFGKELWERQAESSKEAHLTSYEDYLFFILFSLKSGLTYDALGFVFGMTGSCAKKNQTLGIKILKAALHQIGAMPKRIFKSIEEFENELSAEDTIIIDGTEQRVQRPGNQEDQRDFYSGKKKSHR